MFLCVCVCVCGWVGGGGRGGGGMHCAMCVLRQEGVSLESRLSVPDFVTALEKNQARRGCL